MTFFDLFSHFFTHKDYLPPAEEIPGTLFTPLHVVFAVLCLALVIGGGLWLAKKPAATIRRALAVLWVVLLVLELAKIAWESLCGKTPGVEWTGILPLYPCSIFLYALPFAVWGTGRVRYAACGYICTLGLLGGAINFVYPANILSNYSCLSFAGFHTFFYHGSLVLCALVLLRSGYHRYTQARRWWELLLPACPLLAVSVIANTVNFTVGADYMFFKLESFIFAPLGAATPDWLAVLIVYAAYLLIHALPYLPFYVKNRRAAVG